MIVKFGYPKYMPSPYSVYVSHFSDEVLSKLRQAGSFARYDKVDREYEITPEVYEQIKRLDLDTRELNSLPEGNIYEEFTYHTDYEYQYQDDAVNFMHGRDSGLINFSQGMGKTRTSLRILEDKQSKKNLVITGVSNLQEEWLKDGKKHISQSGLDYAEALNMRIVGEDPGVPVKKRVEYLRTAHTSEESFTDLIGIESLRNEDVVLALNALHYDAIIVDEIQSAKGMKAEQTLGLHDLIRTPNQLRLALSGTPVLNDPLEFYSLLRFLGVLYYKSKVDQCSRSTFNKYYGDWGFDKWGHYVCYGFKNLEKLRQLLAPVRIYAPKSLLGLPPKYRQLQPLPVVNPRYDDLKEIYAKGSRAAKRAGFKTIQAVAAEMQYITSTNEPKIQFVVDHIKQGNRPLVFSSYTRVLDTYQKRVEEFGYSVKYYHGKLSSKQRLEVLRQWSAGEGDVLLLSIDTARYGLNLQKTQTAIFIEPPDSPAVLEQAEDRLHRIGQTKPVYSYLLVSGSGDESGWERILRKTEDLSFLNKQ